MTVIRAIPFAAVLAASLVAHPAGVAAATAAPPREAGARLPFIENDYAAAVAQARARGVPIFVEAWAPW